MGSSLAREVGEMCVCECACRYVCVRESQRAMEGRDIEKQRNLENTYGVGE